METIKSLRLLGCISIFFLGCISIYSCHQIQEETINNSINIIIDSIYMGMPKDEISHNPSSIILEGKYFSQVTDTLDFIFRTQSNVLREFNSKFLLIYDEDSISVKACSFPEIYKVIPNKRKNISLRLSFGEISWKHSKENNEEFLFTTDYYENALKNGVFAYQFDSTDIKDLTHDVSTNVELKLAEDYVLIYDSYNLCH